MTRTFTLIAGALTLALALSIPALADDNPTHVGNFVRATSDIEFVMHDENEEHEHTLAADAQVICPDGSVCSLADLKEGQKIRVTTDKNDKHVVIKIESLKE